MGNPLFKVWQASQPFLRKPRLWTAYLLRSLLVRTTFIAITGSNGKSTATRYLAAILSSQAPTQWTRLNRNGPEGATETIAFCIPWKTRFAVFEVGAGRPGVVRKVTQLIRPQVAVVLSVFLEHRSLFKTLEAVANEKAILLSQLPVDGTAVLNADDAFVANMPVARGIKTIRFGAAPTNDIYYEDAESAWPQLLRFTAVVDGERQEIRTRLLGTHWVGPILACIAVARSQGIALDQIARVIRDVSPYPGRMQLVRLPSDAVVIRDEFKGSEHTIAAALEELRKADAGRKFLVFSDVAESSKSPRDRLEKIGRKAAQWVDYAIFIGDRAHHAIRGARKGGLSEQHSLAFPTYQEAAHFLKPILGPDDVVLLKGDRNQQLTRLFFSLVGEVRCTKPRCDRPMVCDDCPEFDNRQLLEFVDQKLTVTLD